MADDSYTLASLQLTLTSLQDMIVASWDAIVKKHPSLIPREEKLKNVDYIKNSIAAIWSEKFYEYERKETAVEQASVAKDALNYHLTEQQKLATESVAKEVQYAQSELKTAHEWMHVIWESTPYGLALLQAYMGKISGRLQKEVENQERHDCMVYKEVTWREEWTGSLDSRNVMDDLMRVLEETFTDKYLKELSENSDSKKEWPAKTYPWSDTQHCGFKSELNRHAMPKTTSKHLVRRTVVVLFHQSI